MRKIRKFFQPNHSLAVAALVLFLSGLLILWVASLRIPALESIAERKVEQSTRIYDRTGTILLYDMSRDTRRVPVALENISKFARDATLAIEDCPRCHLGH